MALSDEAAIRALRRLPKAVSTELEAIFAHHPEIEADFSDRKWVLVYTALEEIGQIQLRDQLMEHLSFS